MTVAELESQVHMHVHPLADLKQRVKRKTKSVQHSMNTDSQFPGLSVLCFTPIFKAKLQIFPHFKDSAE